MNDKKNILLLIIVGLFGISGFSIAEEKTFEITGVVEKILPNSIVVRSEEGLFDVNAQQEKIDIPKNTKVGDGISVYYTMDVKKIAIRKQKPAQKQQPGTIENNKKNIILDDRVFYTAKK